jgi:TatD DNase family protein
VLIDTHCHINMMIKKKFDVSLEEQAFPLAQNIIDEAKQNKVSTIINVGTSLTESINCVKLAKKFDAVFATVGIHPTDCTPTWRSDFEEIKKLIINKKENKIVGVGECGIDLYHPGHNLQRQTDAFKAQIELALEYDLGLVVHSRDAADETLKIIEEYKNDITRGTMHCFSYDQSIAREVIGMGLYIGIDGPITYPKNDELRAVVTNTDLQHIVLETDAPFLPPQHMRGKSNHPKEIKTIAEFIAQIRNQSFQEVAEQTTKNACRLFNIEHLIGNQ